MTPGADRAYQCIDCGERVTYGCLRGRCAKCCEQKCNHELGPPCRACGRELPKYKYGEPSAGLHPGICMRCIAAEACARGEHVVLFSAEPGRCFWCAAHVEQ